MRDPRELQSRMNTDERNRGIDLQPTTPPTIARVRAVSLFTVAVTGTMDHAERVEVVSTTVVSGVPFSRDLRVVGHN